MLFIPEYREIGDIPPPCHTLSAMGCVPVCIPDQAVPVRIPDQAEVIACSIFTGDEET